MLQSSWLVINVDSGTKSSGSDINERLNSYTLSLLWSCDSRRVGEVTSVAGESERCSSSCRSERGKGEKEIKEGKEKGGGGGGGGKKGEGNKGDRGREREEKKILLLPSVALEFKKIAQYKEKNRLPNILKHVIKEQVCIMRLLATVTA